MNDGRPQQSVARTSVAKGRYRLVRQLGEGGMGSVFEGVDTQSGRGVAVKVLRREVATDAQIVQRFLLEAETLSKIRHPNIVQLIESGQEPDGSLFIVQELLSGYDLRSKLEGQRMPIRDAFDIALPIMGALVAAHDKGVLHRDIKPENIFLTRGMSGEIYPKLIDFGLSKTTGQQPPQNMRLTRSGMPIGTPFYMSPEQARAEPDLNGQADVWSLAVVIYEMIAGRCPHQESNLGMLMYKILSEPVPRIEQFAPQVPPDVAALLHRALESDRARRWPTMRQFLTATLQSPSLAAAPGEIDLAARHKNSLPDPRLPVDAFAKTMAIPSATDVPAQQPAPGQQPADWNPSRTAPFLLTPGGAAMKREIDRALDAVRKKNEGGGDTGAQKAVQGQRDSFASTMPGPGNLGSNAAHATPPAMVNTPGAGSFGTTTPGAGPALMQRNSNIPESQMSADIPAAKEEAYSFGPAVNSATPPPSEFDAPPPVVPKTTPWALIVLGSIVVSGAITFAALKLRSGSSGSNATTPTPTVVTDAGAASANTNADAASAADATAAVPAAADAGAAAAADASAAATEPSTVQNPPPGQNSAPAGAHSTHTSSHSSTHHGHSSSGGGFNIVDPNALQHAQQQEGH